MGKNLITYSIVFLLIIPIFGINFVINVIGNIFLLIFLLPILLFIIAILFFTTFNKKTQICTNCGLTTIGNNENCSYCGSSLDINDLNKNKTYGSIDKVIEIEAEEIK